MTRGVAGVHGKMRAVVFVERVFRGCHWYIRATLSCGHVIERAAARGGKLGKAARCPQCREGWNC